MKPYGDLNYRLPALIGFLFAMGGWGFRTVLRRIGCPVATVVFAAMKYGIKGVDKLLVYVITFGLGFGVMTLPITLIGDSVPGNVMNWIWLWMLGGLAGVSTFPLVFLLDNDLIFTESMREFEEKIRRFGIGVAICAVSWGIALTLTNVIPWFEHAWSETVCGIGYGFSAAFIIGKK